MEVSLGGHPGEWPEARLTEAQADFEVALSQKEVDLLETYISMHSETRFSHTLCPDCARELYPDVVKDMDME